MGEGRHGSKDDRARGRGAPRRCARCARPPIPARRPPQGLYDPALDKDACGVGFIADIKGRKSHQIVEDGLSILCNLEHRGAVGADPRMGDGAGILVQIPHKFFAKKAAELGFTLPDARRIRRRPIVHAARRQLAADHPRHLRRDDRARGARPCSAGATCRPTIRRSANRSSRPSRCTCRCSSACGKKKLSEDEFERRLYILRKSISNAIYRRRERRIVRAITRCRSPAAR